MNPVVDVPQRRRRRYTASSITSCAQKLMVEHGLDGFTLDDLATCAGVSRRTLFNYFPGKLDAVVGVKPELPAQDEAEFTAGGPTGDLVEDVIFMVRRLVDTGELTPIELARTRQVLAAEPRLIVHASERLEHDCEHMADLLLQRRGARLDRDQAELLVRVLACSIDAALSRFLSLPEGSERSWADVLTDTIRDVRDLFR
ncbi:MAG: TetR family transcriptional regulator [Ornithinimicrobium sp.]